MKSDIRLGHLSDLAYPTLHQKELGLQKATDNLNYVAQSLLTDPEVLQLADPTATTLKIGRNDAFVNSDEEALLSYLRPPASNGVLPVGSILLYDSSSQA